MNDEDLQPDLLLPSQLEHARLSTPFSTLCCAVIERAWADLRAASDEADRAGALAFLQGHVPATRWMLEALIDDPETLARAARAEYAKGRHPTVTGSGRGQRKPRRIRP